MNNEQFGVLKERILKVNEVIKELDDEIKRPVFPCRASSPLRDDAI
jgi:hypothetical protein